jgi:hypothetical protein
MTQQDVILVLNRLKADLSLEYQEALDEAIEALEKQIPLKTSPNELGISARNPVITPCGYCGMELMDQMWKYCPWCGQRIER